MAVIERHYARHAPSDHGAAARGALEHVDQRQDAADVCLLRHFDAAVDRLYGQGSTLARAIANRQSCRAPLQASSRKTAAEVF
jgi:hypothetical protein